jgi:prephenate dehydratase
MIYKKEQHEKISAPIYGIQGGIASFNEQAILTYFHERKIDKFKIKYLFTTEKVLKNLDKGVIDYGLFAYRNSTAGLVEETQKVINDFKFNLQARIKLKIRHFLMKRKDVSFNDVDTFMSHLQVFRQCKNNLNKKYPKYMQIVGKGDLIDHAKVAWALANEKLPKNIAVIGPKRLADLYNFDIVDQDLQDNDNNVTEFWLVMPIRLRRRRSAFRTFLKIIGITSKRKENINKFSK